MTAPVDVADYLLNVRRSVLAEIEQESQKTVVIHPDRTGRGEPAQMVCYDERGGVVKV